MFKLKYYKNISLATLCGLLLSNPCFASDEVENKILSMQLSLPKVSAPVANYVSSVRVGNLIFISGQLPMEDGKLKYKGKLGAHASEADGIEAAKLCALNILAHLKAEIGSLDKIKRCVKLTGFVNSTPEFIDHPKIINGASDLIVSILGDKGKHTRAAVGVASLPLGASVEIEAIFEIE